MNTSNWGLRIDLQLRSIRIEWGEFGNVRSEFFLKVLLAQESEIIRVDKETLFVINSTYSNTGSYQKKKEERS